MWLPGWFRHHDARSRALVAQREMEKSRRLREDALKRVVRPLVEIHDRNQFSDIIRDALTVGYGKRREERA